jgi:NitT/TauT family transport system substrate-binding protein
MKAAQADMDWYSKAGQLTGDPASLKIDDFWYMDPLNAAK